MANYSTLITAIQSVIRTNGNNEITGALLQSSLLSMINSLGFGYQFAGVATPATNPGTLDPKVFYIASTPGNYPNFGGITVSEGAMAILSYDSAWSKKEIELGQDAVRYTEQQLTDAQKARARDNINAPAVDGYYANLGAGYANTLLGKGMAVPEEFIFARTGGNADIATGVATIKKINGKSYVWNQIAKNGNFAEGTNNWETYGSQYNTISVSNGVLTSVNSASGSAALIQTSLLATIGHKYFITFAHKLVDGTAPTMISRFGTNYFTIVPSSSWVTVAKIITANSTNRFELSFNYGTAVESTIALRDIMVIDLTKMFGANKEPSTAEEFKRLFPKSYYTYNNGEIISFKGDEIKTTGLNQWDEEWEVGAYDTTTGAKKVDSTRIRCANKIPVMPGASYCFTYGTVTGQSMYILFYDSDGNLVSGGGWKNSGVLSIPSNVTQVAFHLEMGYGTTYNHDICIHISYADTTRNGVYEPYVEHKLPINVTSVKSNGVFVFPDGMKSAGSVFDELYGYINGVITNAVKRVGVINLGNLNWSKLDASNCFFVNFSGPKLPSSDGVKANILCSLYQAESADNVYYHRGIDKVIGYWSAGGGDIIIYDSTYTDAAAFKAAMSGVLLFYELATPIDYTLDVPIVTNIQVNDMGTTLLLPENGNEPTTSPANVNIVYDPNVQETLIRLPQVYENIVDFKTTINNLCTALGNALSKNINIVWGGENGTVGNFTITG